MVNHATVLFIKGVITMIGRAEVITFLDNQLKKSSGTEFNVFQIMNWIDTDAIKQTIKDCQNGEEEYIKLGELLSEADSSFDGISFREDCYDYLMANGFDEKEAFDLVEVIRKGQYRFEKHQIKSDKLPDEFHEWAKGVKYLPSRKVLKDMFDKKTIYKQVIIEEFDSYYYKKFK